jgi:hypothetical protein
MHCQKVGILSPQIFFHIRFAQKIVEAVKSCMMTDYLLTHILYTTSTGNKDRAGNILQQRSLKNLKNVAFIYLDIYIVWLETQPRKISNLNYKKW